MKKISSILLATGLSLAAQAASDSWKTDAAGAWTNAASWTGGNIPGSSGGTNSTDVAMFSVTLTTNRTVTVDTNRNIGGITFQNAANLPGANTATSVGYTLSGGGLRLSNGGVIQVLAGSGTNSSTVASDITILGDGGSATFRNDAPGSTAGLLITGSIAGNSAEGNTTLYLDGVSTSAGNGGSSRNNSISGVLENGSAGGELAVVKNGSGLWLLSAPNTFTGGFTFNSGTIRYFGNGGTQFGAGLLTIGDGVIFNHANSGLITLSNPLLVNGNFTVNGPATTAFSGTMDLGAAVRTITVNSSTQTVFSGVISGSGGLTKAGAVPLTLSGANTYSGSTTVSAGELIAKNDHVLGGTTQITVAPAATLTLTNGMLSDYIGDLSRLILSTTSVLNLNFTGTDIIGFLSLDGGASWLTNGIYSAADLTVAGGTGTYTGAGSFRVNSVPLPPRRAALGFQMMGALDVYVFAGQSNMVGTRTYKTDLPPELQAAQTNVFVFNGTDWVVLEPTDTGIGPEISCAYELQKALGKPIGIIKYSVGGTSLSADWNPVLATNNNLYATLTNKVMEARQLRTINVKGMLWMQGESDSRRTAPASAYAQNLTNLIQAARADFNSPAMPFVAGRVNPPAGFELSYMVRAAQESCTSTPYAWVNCDDLPKNSDNLHYSTAGQIELGKRFAQSILNLR
jgi:autotransporter-associated beta strand protein